MSLAGLLVDVVVAVIILIYLFLGKKRGLMLSLYTAFAWTVAIVLAFCLRAPVAAALRSTGLEDTISNGIYTQLETQAVSLESSSVSGEDLAELLRLPDFVKIFLEEQVEDFRQAQRFDPSARSISDSAAALLINVLAFLILLILIFVGLHFLKSTLNFVRRLPVLHQVDTIGGALFGAAEGVLTVCFVALLLSLFASSPSLQGLLNAVGESTLGAFFYQNNFLGGILASVLGS